MNQSINEVLLSRYGVLPPATTYEFKSNITICYTIKGSGLALGRSLTGLVNIKVWHCVGHVLRL